MKASNTGDRGERFPPFQGLLPIKGSPVPSEIIAGSHVLCWADQDHLHVV